MFLKFRPTEDPMSLLRSSQRAGFLSTLILTKQPQKSSSVLFLNLLFREGNTNFLGLTTSLGDQRGTSICLGAKAPRVTNTNISGCEDEPSA